MNSSEMCCVTKPVNHSVNTVAGAVTESYNGK